MNLKRLLKRNKAFTLIEVLMALAITAILVGVFFSIFRLSIFSYQQSSTEDELYYTGNHVIDHITFEIKRAQGIYPIDETSISDSGFPLGFLLRKMNTTSEQTGEKYNYVYYVFRHDKIYRKALNTSIEDVKSLSSNRFTTNALADHIKNINGTGLYGEVVKLDIDVEVDGKLKNFTSEVSTYLKERK